MTRNFPRRLQRLEMHLAQQRLACLDDKGRTLVKALRESRRRRLAAQGRESEMDRPKEYIYDDSNPPRTLGETIRQARFARRSAALPLHSEVAERKRGADYPRNAPNYGEPIAGVRRDDDPAE